MSLRIITTGGTFEKHYDPVAGQLGFSKSQVPEILWRSGFDIPVSELMLLDSLQMTDTERQILTTACTAADENRLVIVHGTDTMVESAQAVASANLSKTIVFTGAMIPFEVSGTDAPFNLGFALASAQQARHGVWIAMHGRLFEWDTVQKNREIARFEDK